MTRSFFATTRAPGATREDYTSSLTRSPRADVARATGWGLFVASLVLAGVYFSAADASGISMRRLSPWKITKIEMWEQAYVDLVVPGFCRIRDGAQPSDVSSLEPWSERSTVAYATSVATPVSNGPG
jgi:hypothetical protein